MKIGIDQMAAYVPHFALPMTTLAEARQIDPMKFKLGIGQDVMAVQPVTEDSVTMAANAVQRLFDHATDEDMKRLSRIRTVVFATESGVDHSKAGGVFLADLFNFERNTRFVEMKQACYSATAGLQFAYGEVLRHPNESVLVIASDSAKYGLNTPGEPTQGAGSIAMLVTAEPRIAALSNERAVYSENIPDFWRPLADKYPRVDGKFSNEAYIKFFNQVTSQYFMDQQVNWGDFAAICTHIPYTKMGKKALLQALNGENEEVQSRLMTQFEHSTQWSRLVGNLYTGSLYLGFFSLLSHSPELKVGDRVGMFSYGSGAVAEFYTLELMPNYSKHIHKEDFERSLQSRYMLTIDEYEQIFNEEIPSGEGDYEVISAFHNPAHIQIVGVTNHHRMYKK
ncbi:hydroxymethylglutaryl-CoA synthase [Atopobacter phocae]|uniref:hydroxymethylglutaryl-CoA synthase n=1 Tax=Atopobacter phocae TaxID=136492 RepID=UPI00046FD6E3|nr:hydroxymethylglutaryl-CoA synthase [Atopobacter phocae]